MKYINKKNGALYEVINMNVIDCTNKREGERVVLYKKDNLLFTREYNEFHDKFYPLSTGLKLEWFYENVFKED